MRPEKLFISPLEFSLEDTQAIQAAVNAAKEEDIQVVSIPQKPDGSPWHLTAPVRLPSYMTVILDGALVEAEDIAFCNENAFQEVASLGGEQHKIFLLGRHGGTIRSLGGKPQVLLRNCRDCRVAELSFEGGAGLDLCFLRYSKLQHLRILGGTHAVTFREGCNNIILESVWTETTEEALVTLGGDASVLGRKPDIYNSIFCRIRTKTAGGPGVRLTAGKVPLYNIVLRDVTDETGGEGPAVVIGQAEDTGAIRDITVRGVQTERDAVHTAALCDGMFYSNLRCRGKTLTTAFENTRQVLDMERMEIVWPQFPAQKPDRPFLTPNDPAFYGETDGLTLQNTVDAASQRGINLVVIPRWNVRTQKALWDVERAVKIPSNMTIVFLQAYLRQADFCYENMFTNTQAYEHEDRCIEREEHDLTFTGIGDVVLDGGIQNGLLEKTCNMYGFPDKRYNATVLFNNVRNLVLENMQFRQSRWYGTYFIHCDTCRISNLDFDYWEDCCNRDGVDIRSGCHNFLVENITGTTGDDTVALNNLGNDGNDGRYVRGKDPDTLHMVIRNIKSDAGRWFTVRLLCQDRHLEQDFTIDTILDTSESENQKGVTAAVMIGSHEYHYKIPAQVGDLAHLTIRDVYTRSRKGVAFGGCSDDVFVSNVHGYGDCHCTFGVQKEANIRDVRAVGIFHKREQLRLYGAQGANRQAEGVAIDMPCLKTENLRISHVYCDSARIGIFLTGQAKVTMDNVQIENAEQAIVCGSNCTLVVDGCEIPQTATMPL